MSKVVAVYPGRFQPFGPHHKAAYDWLANQFGKDNTYLVTSDKVSPPESPFSFEEKKRIAEAQGVPGTKIIKVKNPYQSLELVQTLPEDTAVVFMYGEKDADRISYTKKDGSPGYFQPLPKDISKLAPYKEHGYIVVSPDAVQVNVPGIGRLTGTLLRDKLRTASPDLFKKLMGWYDPKLYNLVISKLKGLSEYILVGNKSRITLSDLQEELQKDNKLEDFNSFFEQILEDRKGLKAFELELLTEGGAYGHMQHPYEDKEATFNDLITMTNQVLAGDLDVSEEPVREKTDGQNIQVTYKDGKIKAARNKGTVINPMDIEQMQLKFQGRGEIETAFVQAMTDLEQALLALPTSTLDKIFQNGRVFLNVEVLYPKTKNIIKYGEIPYLVLLGLIYYDENGNQVREESKAGPNLYHAIERVNKQVQSTFTIRPPNFVELNKIQGFDQKAPEFTNQLKQLAASVGLSTGHTLQDYLNVKWQQVIKKQFPQLPDEQVKLLVTRWAQSNNSVRLDNKTFGAAAGSLKDFENSNKKAIDKALSKPLDDLFLNVGSEVLSNITNYLSADQSEAVKDIRSQLAQVVKQARASQDPAIMDKVRRELERIKAAGGFNRIVPAEGILYWFNGKLYKLTGTFAPINQLIGLFKYAR